MSTHNKCFFFHGEIILWINLLLWNFDKVSAGRILTNTTIMYMLLHV